MISMVNYCKILDLEGEKCDKLNDFLRNACNVSSAEPEPELWKGRDLRAEWKELYKKITGG
jgi:hypothetical protein